MGVVRVILAIIVGIYVISGIDESFRKTGGDKALTMLFTTLLICIETWLIGG